MGVKLQDIYTCVCVCVYVCIYITNSKKGAGFGEIFQSKKGFRM
jgi:hypothetical protein